MKRFGFAAVLVLGVLASALSMEMSCGIAASTDSVLLSVGLTPVRGLSLAAAAGPAWERKADLRVNDVEIRCSARYAPWTGGNLAPYAVAGYELLLVDTSYSWTAAHGFLLGAGTECRFRSGTGIYLQGGWRGGRGTVRDEYHGPAASVFYEEIWKAPWFWADFGMRIYLDNEWRANRRPSTLRLPGRLPPAVHDRRDGV